MLLEGQRWLAIFFQHALSDFSSGILCVMVGSFHKSVDCQNCSNYYSQTGWFLHSPAAFLTSLKSSDSLLFAAY